MARYTLNDIEYPSVTELTGLLDKSGALMGWAVNSMAQWIRENARHSHEGTYILEAEQIDLAKKEYRNISKEACEIGTEVHNMIEWHIKSIINDEPMPEYKGERQDEVQNGYLAFLEWEKDNVVKWHKSELVVENQEFGYAGTMDAIAELKDKGLYVIDFKTSKGFYDGFDLQLSAYRNCVTDYDIVGMGVLRLDKETGLPEWKDYSKKYKRALKAFLSLVEYYYSAKKRRLKNNPLVNKYSEELDV